MTRYNGRDQARSVRKTHSVGRTWSVVKRLFDPIPPSCALQVTKKSGPWRVTTNGYGMVLERERER